MSFREVCTALSIRKKPDLPKFLRKKEVLDRDGIPYPDYSEQGYFLCQYDPHPVYPKQKIIRVFVTTAGLDFIRSLKPDF